MSDPRDTGAYRIAVGAVGFALVTVLIGICVIVAVGRHEEIPKELWTIASALGGGLLGLLAPPPTSSPAPETSEDQKTSEKMMLSLKRLRKDAGANRSVVILLLIFVVSVVLGAASDSSQFQALAGASGGALIGLLAPTPDKRHV
jgi:hypothetical protein